MSWTGSDCHACTPLDNGAIARLNKELNSVRAADLSAKPLALPIELVASRSTR